MGSVGASTSFNLQDKSTQDVRSSLFPLRNGDKPQLMRNKEKLVVCLFVLPINEILGLLLTQINY